MAIEDYAPSRSQIAAVVEGIDDEGERIIAVTQFITENEGIPTRYKDTITAVVLSDLDTYS